MNYSEMSTIELRTLVRERGLAKGGTVASARKEDLIALLNGGAALPSLGELPLTPRAPTAQAGDLADIIAQALQGKIGASMDRDAVSAIVDETLTTWQRESLPAIIAKHAPQGGPVIHMPELPAPVKLPEGEFLHSQFTQVLSWLRAGVPVWAWGSPGSGKTHMGRQLAAALGVECFTMSIDETTTANKLLGFQNLVSGDFVPGWLYKPYLTGGLVVIDEIDTGNPGIIAGLNALISNGHYMFPNGETVQKHPQFAVMACANTNGTGAIAGFTARQRLDAATLNRFAMVRLEYDKELEKAICTGTKPNNTQWQPVPFKGEDLCARWVNWVQSVRTYAGKNVLISPRPSILGCKALRAGIPPKEVADALIFSLCAEDTAKNIRDNCGNPATL